MEIVLLVCQLIVGLGILNVWLIRAGRKTDYRGGDAANLKDEFITYGLPGWSVWVIGLLKVGAALSLLAGIWLPQLVAPAAGVIAFLMLGALVMHVKVKDAPKKSIPAAIMLALSLILVFMG